MMRPKLRRRLALERVAARHFLDGYAGVADYGDDSPGKGGRSGPRVPPQPLGPTATTSM